MKHTLTSGPRHPSEVSDTMTKWASWAEWRCRIIDEARRNRRDETVRLHTRQQTDSHNHSERGSLRRR